MNKAWAVLMVFTVYCLLSGSAGATSQFGRVVGHLWELCEGALDWYP